MKQFLFLFLAVILLTGCASIQASAAQPTPEAFVTATLPATSMPMPTSSDMTVMATPTTDPSIFEQLFPGSNTGNELTRTDQQGMVVVEVTPLNLGTPADTLIFEVAMNTHSVDLSMELAQLSTLTTDTGVTVQALVWDAPLGGHHVSGKLTFPGMKDGVSIMDGVTNITLQIRNVDADLRIFEWQLK